MPYHTISISNYYEGTEAEGTTTLGYFSNTIDGDHLFGERQLSGSHTLIYIFRHLNDYLID
jgi:hypothetical protein